MKRGIFCFLGIIMLTTAFCQPAFAQANEGTPLIYEELMIHLMPQYAEPDEGEAGEPAVLVGIHGTLVNESGKKFSNEIRIPLPYEKPGFQFSQVGEVRHEEPIHNVDSIVEEGSGDIVWKPDQVIEPGGEYHFLLEYYFTPEQEGNSYKFSYLYELEREANMLNILFFEPFGAENFLISLDDGYLTNIQGIPVHVFDIGDAEAGKLIEATAAYDKEDNATTLEAMEALSVKEDDNNVQSAEGDLPEAAEGSQPVDDTEGIIMIGLSIVIVVLFLFFALKHRRDRAVKAEHQDNDRQTAAADDIKVLRTKLIRGEIDEETYRKEREKHLS